MAAARRVYPHSQRGSEMIHNKFSQGMHKRYTSKKSDYSAFPLSRPRRLDSAICVQSQTLVSQE